MVIDGHKMMETLQEMSYHYRAETEMLEEICSRLDRQCSLIKENLETKEMRTLFEISKESALKSRDVLEQLREAKERTDTLTTYYQKIFEMKFE